MTLEYEEMLKKVAKSRKRDVINQQRNGYFFEGRVKTRSNVSAGPLASIGEQVAAGRERRYPGDYRKYMTPGQTIYRGETRFVPEHVNTPSAIVDHLFQPSGPSIGQSWSLEEDIADKFANRRSMTMHNVPQPEGTVPVEILMHSKLDPNSVSFDSGSFKFPDGQVRVWDNKSWRQRLYDGPNRPKGVYGESEVIMKHESELPIHGVTVKHGGKLNSFQFDPPITATTFNDFIGEHQRSLWNKR